MSNINQQSKRNLLSINGIDVKIREEFVAHAKDNGLTQAELLKTLWNNYQNFYIPLDQEEQALVNKAQNISAKSINRKLKKALLRLSQNVLESKITDDTIIDKDKKNSSKAADIRVAEIVNEIMVDNESEPLWYNRKFLSQRAIFDYALERKAKDSNNLSLSASVINRYLENNKDKLNEHHTRLGMGEDHNRKAHYERMKLANNKE